ncbi:Apple domain-containing protein [Durusdinium trenchii]|uniref:Apple domain-containing protein n=1 Tax=Durusdinium trenchii TaxID=1381693 RepID=A0ABP0NHX2_9DINO
MRSLGITDLQMIKSESLPLHPQYPLWPTSHGAKKVVPLLPKTGTFISLGSTYLIECERACDATEGCRSFARCPGAQRGAGPRWGKCFFKDRNSWKSDGIIDNIKDTLTPDAIGLQECDSPSSISSRTGVLDRASVFKGAQGEAQTRAGGLRLFAAERAFGGACVLRTASGGSSEPGVFGKKGSTQETHVVDYLRAPDRVWTLNPMAHMKKQNS